MSCVEGIIALDECYKREIIRTSMKKKYEVIEPVGKGKYGFVWKIVNKETGVPYAAKYIKKDNLKNNGLASIYHEIALLKKFKSKCFVHLHEVFEARGYFTLIFDFLEGGDLKSVFKNVKHLSETDTKSIIKQVLESVRILHVENVVHMDIKMRNILLSKPNCFENLKLCDFGLSRWLEPGKEVRTSHGTLDYMSPEIVTNLPITTKADIWSIGVLTYRLLCRHFPFKGNSRFETMINIARGDVEFDHELFDCASNEVISFIKSTFFLQATRRPTAEELLKHAWFTT